MGSTEQESRRPVGRPRRIDRTAIADAVLRIGLDGINMKAVADELGVSVPGLYHHVGNRKELLLLAAERSLAQMRPPEDEGQHWYEWLREWARYSRQSFVEEPEVFAQYLKGAISVEATAEVVDSVIRVLSAHGFDAADALSAWVAVGDAAVGAAVDHIRWQAAAERGDEELSELEKLLDSHGVGDLRGVRAAFAISTSDLEHQFEENLTTLLVGIAVRRGEAWEPIVRSSQTSIGKRL
jgi:AcrR family transcriptional regulator